MKSTCLMAGMIVVFAILLTSISSQIDYNHKQIIEIASIVTIMLINIKYKDNYATSNTRIQFVYLLILFLGLLSSLISSSPKHALIEVLTYLGLSIIAFNIAPAWEKKIFCTFSILSLILCLVIIEAIFLSNYLAYITLGNNFSIHEFFPTFANVRFFNQHQIWTMPFISFILIQKHTLLKRYNTGLWIMSGIWWLMFFSTGSRGVIVSELITIMIIAYLFKSQIKELAIVTMKLVVFGLISYQLLFYLLPDIINYNSALLTSPLEIRTNTDNRMYLWNKAFQFIIKNPLLGIGPMHYAWSEIQNTGILNNISHPHNSLLQWGAEWGLFSLSLIFMLYIRVLIKWFNKFNIKTLPHLDKNHSNLVITVTISIISASVYSLFSGVIVMPSSQLTALLPISLMISLYQEKPENQGSINKNLLNNPYFIASITLLYLALLIPDIITIISKGSSNLIDIHQHYPRFWLNGRLLTSL